MWASEGWLVACIIDWDHMHVCNRRKNFVSCWSYVSPMVSCDMCVLLSNSLGKHTHWNFDEFMCICYILFSFWHHDTDDIISVLPIYCSCHYAAAWVTYIVFQSILHKPAPGGVWWYKMPILNSHSQTWNGLRESIVAHRGRTRHQ